MAQTVNHIKGNISLVLMHSGIVNGYQLLCDAHTVLELQLFSFYSLLSFSTFSFYVFVTLTVLLLGASLVCVYNLKRTADLVLWFPDRTSVCNSNTPLMLIVLKASLNPTKLKLKHDFHHFWHLCQHTKMLWLFS